MSMKVMARGIAWSAIENFATKAVTFLIQIFIARLLAPEDYGTIAMLSVFMAIASTFVDSGFSLALIQKNKECDQLDYSTVFYFNTFIAILMYCILLLSSQTIANFYNQPILYEILPFVGLSLIISSLSAIHKTKLVINIDFKTQAKASIISALFSGLLGLYLAYEGFGVWALVYQMLTLSSLNSLLLIYQVRWIPSLIFSFERLKKLFSFGINILISSLTYTLYAQSYIFIIGKKFSSTDLGYYSRADQLYSFPSSNIVSILKRVYFPVLCNIKDNKEELLNTYRKTMQFSCMIVFPLMMCLSILSEPTVSIILGEKWLGCIWILQILCFRGMLFPITNINLDILNAIGHSKVYLKINLIVHTVSLVLVFILSLFSTSIKELLFLQILIVYGSLALNLTYIKKYIGYSIIDFIKDIFSLFLRSILIAFFVHLFISSFEFGNLFKLLIGLILYTSIYLSTLIYFNDLDIKKRLKRMI